MEGAAQVTVITDSGDGFELSPYSELPDASTALIPEQASVVVCMTVTDSKVVETCEFEDDDTGEKFTQELADATYEGRAVVAATGCRALRPSADEEDLRVLGQRPEVVGEGPL